MKIAIDARLYSGTSGRVAREFLDRLHGIDPDNEYFILMLKKDIELFKPEGLNIHVIEADIPYYSFAEQILLPKLLDDIKPDLAHFFMPQQPLLYKGLKTTMIHDLILYDIPFKKPLKGLNGWMRNTVKPMVFRKILPRLIADSAAVVTPSNYVTDQIKTRFSPQKVVTIYNGTSPISDKEPEQLSGFLAPFICFAGNLFPYKNLRKLVLALPAIRLQIPHLELVIVGKKTGLAEELEHWIKQNNIEGVRFTGFISDEQLSWVYQNAKALVHPSLSEGFGLTGLEAMHENTPVASSNATCLPEIYGDAALYFDPNSSEDIAEKTVQLIQDEELRAELRSKHKDRLALYSWDRMSEQLVELFKDVLEAKNSKSDS